MRQTVFVIVFVFVLAGAVSAQIPSHAREVRDCTGRTVRLPEKIDRIACLYAFTGHAVTLLGRGEDIVAVSKGLKRDSLLLEICPSIQKARVPKSQGGVNIEELLQARPDIVFLSGDIGKNTGETEKLDATHIPYLIVDYTTLAEQQQAVSIIGDAINRPGRAKAYRDYYTRKLGLVKKGLDNLPEKQRIRVYHSVNEATRTAIPRSLSTGWLDTLGVINVSDSSRTALAGGKQFVSMEQILVWNPDVILVNEPSAKTLILSDTAWAPLRAVRQNAVYLLPIALSRWGHPGSIETPLAVLWAARTLYPDRFKTLDMTEETRFFYREFFGHELTDAEIRDILDGKRRRKPKRKTP